MHKAYRNRQGRGHKKMSDTSSGKPTFAKASARESKDIERTNKSNLQPIVFVHGLWLLPNSWDRWTKMAEEAGYIALAPGWPDDPETAEEARTNPGVFSYKSIRQIADHVHGVISALERKPALIGHSLGGLLVQILAGRGLAVATVAIDPAPFRGVLPLPLSSLRAVWPILHNPANWYRAVPLTFAQFRFAFANAVSEQEARELYLDFSVPGSGVALFQAAFANFNPWTEAKVNKKNPARGPLLIISGKKDNIIPWAIANASYKQQRQGGGVTEVVEIPGRGHSLVIDSGWRDVAIVALGFVRRFT
jgi:non-heme chloroperoxidase